MEKERKILFNFTSYILLGILICLIGLSNVFASTYYTDYGYAQQYYDNYGSSLSTVSTTWNESLQSYVSANITTVANSYGAGLSITSPIPIINNHTYTISIYFEERNNIALSSKPSISIGNSLSSASYNYSTSNYWVDTIQSTVSNNRVLQYVFKANGNANFLFIPWTTTSTTTASYVLTSVNMEDLGSEGISQEDINNSLNSQTNVINDSINNLGEEIKDTITDNFNSCGSNLISSSNLNQYSNTLVSLKNFLEIDNSITYTYRINSGYFISVRFYDDNKNYLGLTTLNSSSGTINFSTFNSNIKYIDILFSKNTSLNTNTTVNDVKNMNPYFGSEEICSNKIDETNDKLDQTNDKLNDLNNSLNNSNSTGATNDASSFFSNFTTDTFGLTSIITAPLNIINSITSSSCNNLSLPLPYLDNKYLTLPCMGTIYSRYFGVFFNLYQTITFGIVSYWVIVRIFNQVKDFKNPEHDEIEVLDL